ncbi:SDR family oxidoreductase [Kribbella yunnanensis]|uniref:SDR family oxidoreductase n=1 Tax=Kribbella yunnanensis TaxID=190194 RepID=A0ABN2IVF0_9ACTN
MSNTGRVALITGATSGIGRATAIELASHGDFVIVSGRDKQRAEETCDAIRDVGGECAVVLADLTDVASTEDLARGALAAGNGRVDIIVNNAGGALFDDGNQFKLTAAVSPAEYERVFALNARAPFQLTAALAPTMVEHGGGSIINILALSADLGVPGVSVFGGAKAAVASFTRTWAVEFAPAVRVNAIDLGAIDTPIHANNQEMLASLTPTIPAQRLGRSEEVASVVAFLASDAASYVSGVVLPVDGGRLITF